MTFIDILLLVGVALLAAGAIYLMRKNKGSHCSSCSGCSGCPSAGACAQKECEHKQK